MEIAIRYEKIDLGDDRFVFKPIGIVYGRYDEINGVFVTEYDEKFEAGIGADGVQSLINKLDLDLLADAAGDAGIDDDIGLEL